MKDPVRVHLQSGRATSLRSMMEEYVREELSRRSKQAVVRSFAWENDPTDENER